MDYQLIWTASSREDLRQIVRFVASDDPAAAKALGETLIEQIEQAASFPRSGRVVPEYQMESLRELICAPYRIIYEISEAERIIAVLRIWHASRGHPVIGMEG